MMNQSLKDTSINSMQDILKHKMREKVISVRNEDAYIDSLLRITAYKDHNKLIREEFKHRVQILDETYNRYTFWADIVQISIIILSSISSVVQAANCERFVSEDTVDIFSLIITAYTGLVLALAKYKKIEERKEATNNIRHQCADFLTEIQTRNDKLNTWCYDKMWAGGDLERLKADWKNEDNDLYQELVPLIEKKQKLTCEFEKIIDTKTVKKLLKTIREQNLKFKKESIEFTIKEDALDIETNNLEAKRKTQQSTAFYKAKIKNDITIPNRPNIGLRGSMPIRPTIQVRSGVGNDTNVIQVNNNEDPQNNTYIFRQRNNLSEKSDKL